MLLQAVTSIRSAVLAIYLFVFTIQTQVCVVVVTSLTAEWLELQPATKISPRRSGHASFGTLDRHYVFGGYVETEDSSNTNTIRRYVTNDLWRWQKNNWHQVISQGNLPPACLVAASALVEDSNNDNNAKAYLFGGWDPGTEGTGGNILDTVHELDLNTYCWRRLNVSMPDGPTSRHVAVSLKNSNTILIHNHRCIGNVWLFDPTTEIFRRQPTTGPTPSSRGLHAATRLEDDSILIFGGASKDGGMSNEAFRLDTHSWAWEQVGLKSTTRPSPRAAPCLTVYDQHCVILFGGAEASTEKGLKPKGDVWALHLDSDQWELLLDDDDLPISNSKTPRPPPRNAASMAPIIIDTGHNPTTGKEFLLSGGWHPFLKTWDDCFVLRIS